jgi:hypothetical protein
MSLDRNWWVQQKRLALTCLSAYEEGASSLARLAEDMESFSTSFAAQGSGETAALAAFLSVSPRDWLNEFESAAGGIEVVSAVAMDRGWSELPGGVSAEIDKLRIEIKMLLRQIPDA